jgi:hypothetical protein
MLWYNVGYQIRSIEKGVLEMNTEDYDDDNLDSFDSWLEEYRRWLEDDLDPVVHITDLDSPLLAHIKRMDREIMVEYLEGTVPSAQDNPCLKVYEDYLNRKDGE